MIDQKFPHLMQPFTVRGVYFRNHLFSAPCALSHVTNGAPNDLGIGYLEEKARGGFAQVTQGNLTGPGGYGDNGGMMNHYETNWKNEMAFTELAWAIRQHGAVPSAALAHAGMLAGVEENYGTLPMSSTGFIRNDFVTHVGNQSDGIEVREMTEKDIQDTITYFANIAKYAKKCGFQMCMLHAGHEMLVNQFMSPHYNKRKDCWGGSPENRIRFPKMILQRIREECGDDFPIEVRISADDRVADGKNLEESIFFVKECEDLIDFVHCSAGCSSDTAYLTQSVVYQPEGTNVDFAWEMKKAGVKPLVVAMGGIVTPEYAESILAEGKADVISMARAGIADPDYAKKLRRGEPEEIRPCLRCNNCLGGEKAFFLPRCMVNPEFAHEARVHVQKPATESRKVLIIGAGPAGMQAAVTAADRGHKVVLADKNDALGGTIRFSDHDSIKYTLKRYKDYMIRQIGKRPIDVRLNTEASEALVEAVRPDSIIVATGADPIVPKIPGIEKAMYATEVYYHPEKVGKKVAIIGGGLVGTEVGLHLAKTEHEVVVVEMLDEIAKGDQAMHHSGMMALWNTLPISAKVSTTVQEVTDTGLRCTDAEGNEFMVEADTVIYCVGLRPNPTVYNLMSTLCHDTQAIGDCTESARIVDAVHAGWNTAIDLA